MQKIIIGFIFFLMLIVAGPAWATTVESFDVTLQWDANTESDLAGYGVYWDNDASGAPYGNTLDFTLVEDENADPDIVEKTITGLTYGTMYWFVVDAFDNETPKLRSEFSNEVFTDGEISMPPAEPKSVGFIRIIKHMSDGTTVTIEVQL